MGKAADYDASPISVKERKKEDWQEESQTALQFLKEFSSPSHLLGESHILQDGLH